MVIVDESYTERSKSEWVHKSINGKKYAKNETEHKENLVPDNPVVKEPSYFNLFECGKNLLNRLDATCERVCMANSRNKYYTEILKTLTD